MVIFTLKIDRAHLKIQPTNYEPCLFYVHNDDMIDVSFVQKKVRHTEKLKNNWKQQLDVP